MPSFRFASATGSGSSLIVTCSDQFAGKTITCTNGTKTYTRTCPSTSPYEVVFKGVAPGTWTVSGVVEGTTYSQQVVITDFDVILTTGFDYKQWVILGGLDPTDYTDLEDVFADEVAVRRLMTIHASADYLIEKVTDNIDEIDDFTANDTAMKWIGLRDYVCDGLTAIAGVEAKFMASQYWERYLKDHVPAMTSNTAPYGTASAASVQSNYSAYFAFDRVLTRTNCWIPSQGSTVSNSIVGYKFTNPICVKRVDITTLGEGSIPNATFSIQGSNDNSEWTDLITGVSVNRTTEIKSTEVDISNNDYYLYYRLVASTALNPTAGNNLRIIELQFYGRSLDVSVPVMTSNTAPFGQASANRAYDSNSAAWKAFDGNDSTQYSNGAVSNLTDYLQFEFPSKMRLKMFISKIANDTLVEDVTLRCSNDGSTFTDIDTYHYTTKAIIENVSVNEDYKIFRLQNAKALNSGWFNCLTLQFYGVDYSEKEFETGSTKKWLYDHGVELENIEINDNTTKEDDYISIKATTTTYYGMIVPTNSIDLTDYSIERVKIGHVMSGGVQIQASTQKTSYNSGRIGYKTFNVAASDLPNNLYYDVSAVNQSAYPNIVTSQVNSTIDISEWWLE